MKFIPLILIIIFTSCSSQKENQTSEERTPKKEIPNLIWTLEYCGIDTNNYDATAGATMLTNAVKTKTDSLIDIIIDQNKKRLKCCFHINVCDSTGETIATFKKDEKELFSYKIDTMNNQSFLIKN